jgi:UPF0755 protein
VSSVGTMSDRSAEERELARRERERRRLERGAQDGSAGWDGPEPTMIAPADDWLEDDDEPPPSVPRQEPSPAARRPPPPRAPRPRRHSLAGRTMAVLALLVVGLVLWFLLELFQPFHGTGHGAVTVTIPPDASTNQIADLLDRDGVFSCTFPSCSLLFEIRAKLDGSELRSGIFDLKRGMSFGDVITALSHGPPPAKVTEVTITPGRTRSYVAARLAHEHVPGSYLKATKRSPVLKPTAYGAPASTPDLEGFLFPDTYQLRVPIRISALVKDQLKDFQRHFKTVSLAYARAHHLTAYDVLIVASMVEGEAETAHDRPLIASVIYNRLRLGMPLQIDATVRYASGNYTRPITTSQLHSSSPWNTYVHKGLPPTPIDSPGLASIQAAAHPAQTNFLYFVVKPCGNGEHAFASTYAQFLQEERQYQTARSQRGGRSPERCSSKP